MTSLLASRLFEYALNTLWQLPLLAASTWLLIRLARPSVALQHALWIATLVLATALPLRGAVANSTPVSLSAPLSINGSAPLASPGTHAPLHVIQLTPSLVVHIAQSWALALAFNLLRLVYAWITARRLIAASRPLDPEALDPAILEMCAGLLQISIPEIRLTPASTPAVAGILTPVLLLPSHLTHHYDLTAVLLHEFAHIRRRDTFANLLCRFVALPIAWHPVTPLLHRRIAQTREILCDALAAHATGSPTLYARSLITLSRDLQPLTQPRLTQGLFPASSHPSALEERIMTLITPRPLAPANRAMRLASGLAVILTATGVASSIHLKPAHAQQSTPLPTALAATQTSAKTDPHSQAQAWNLAIKPGAYLDRKDGKTWHLTMASAQPLPAPPPPPQATAPLPPLPALAPFAHPLPSTPTAPPAAIPPLPPVAPVAPQAAPAPVAPTPSPSPSPAPRPHARIIVNGIQRDLTPQERADLDKQIAAARQQIHTAFNQKFIDEKALAAQLKALKSGEVQRQIADAQKQINSPEFQKQIAEAGRLAADKAVNSEEFRHQMDQAMQQVKIAQASLATQKLDIHIDQAKLQLELKAASEATADARINVHIDTAQIQKQLESARKQLEEARRNNQ